LHSAANCYLFVFRKSDAMNRIHHYSIVIVGGGIIGAAVFNRLTQTFGPNVLLIEKSRQGFGATAFSGGILRAYHIDQRISYLCSKGIEFYRNLARTSDSAFFVHRTGFLQLIDSDHREAAQRSYEDLKPHVTLEWLTASEASGRFSLAENHKLSAAVFEPEAGYVDPLQVSRVLITMGKAAGGITMEGVELQDIDTANGSACAVITNCGRISCDRVILCTGAWTPNLTQRIGALAPVELRSKAIQVNIISRNANAIELPAFADACTEAYGRPEGKDYALIGSPVDLWDVDPEILTAPTDDARADALSRARKCFQWIDESSAMGGYRRHDAYDATGRGIVAWAVGMSGVLIAAGFSGSGVKLAPSVAEAVASHIQAPSDSAYQVS
jgi:sarcosine oxidase subunit beta